MSCDFRRRTLMNDAHDTDQGPAAGSESLVFKPAVAYGP